MAFNVTSSVLGIEEQGRNFRRTRTNYFCFVQTTRKREFMVTDRNVLIYLSHAKSGENLVASFVEITQTQVVNRILNVHLVWFSSRRFPVIVGPESTTGMRIHGAPLGSVQSQKCVDKKTSHTTKAPDSQIQPVESAEVKVDLVEV